MRVMTALFLLFSASPTFAADRYLDDRSNPDTLIRSLYSAINLHQYSRAYTYYSDPPAKDYETYTKGFADTAHVDVVIGTVTGEGAAGSTFSNVPALVRAKDTAGHLSYFSGCYVVRQINADQDPPYTPLQIHSAKLKAAKQADYDHKVMPVCGDI